MQDLLPKNQQFCVRRNFRETSISLQNRPLEFIQKSQRILSDLSLETFNKL
ncbi:hypothetical protein LEP1GSC082_2426 [Leptospira kirschneri str. H2]|uniref:Uncharacterized protein n=2 Tax=Leptospira kirschneri TaxID=29507 RepID=A0A0E2B2C3_9LEPT|nr:hypothetical protein LEP1GSC081_1257 [Leptospira kirschneri str. H1]EKO60712.1 hypothetical protein LEP1GSC082_2426 [Leptospira kirschneri str. H2]EMK24125.1 hypothetical protein LEP1GSC008_2913 [Leptospira kirschneri serovar Bulgarica str. Nikolaevo]